MRDSTCHPYDERLLFRPRLLSLEEPEEHAPLVDLHIIAWLLVSTLTTAMSGKKCCLHKLPRVRTSK